MKLKEVIFVIHYNQYTELSQEELKKIANKIQELNLSEKYKVTINQSPIITQIDPMVSIEFVKGDNWENIFAKLVINPFQMQVSFIVDEDIDSPNSYRELAIQFLQEKVTKLWEAFNEVANRKVIERLGLVTNFTIPMDTYSSLLSQCRHLYPEKFKYMTLRLMDIYDHQEPFYESVRIVANLFIELKLSPELEPEGAFLISDIAMPPNSKGVVDVPKVAEAFRKMIDISMRSMEKIRGRNEK